MLVLTPQQMREADGKASQIVGDVSLMRAAGERIAEVIRMYARGSRVVAFTGPGNNGGDAFAALALLPEFERRVYAQPAPQPSSARLDAEERATRSGVRVYAFPDSKAAALEAVGGAETIVVGLVGTGARLPLPEIYANVFDAITQAGAPVLAIDIPPGLDGATGEVVAPALHATITVTLAALKPGLILYPGREYTGELWLGSIGMPPGILDAQSSQFRALSDGEFNELLPVRADLSDKRAAGAPLIIAGSEQFPGAAVLATMGAARAGAGYVTLATPQSAAGAVRAHLLEQVAVTFDVDSPAKDVVEQLLDVAKRCTAAGIGPGLSLDDRTGEIVRGFIGATDLPIVADASALFHLAKNLDLLRGKRIVLTPHAGEFSRLSGRGTVAEMDRVSRLREFVNRTGIVTLLKGGATLIDDGVTMHVNTTGTPALATAGTGDVLTGIIATLLSQGLNPVDAARAGAYWHGLAGRHASSLRPRGVIARDVYEALAAAIPTAAPKEQALQRIF